MEKNLFDMYKPNYNFDDIVSNINYQNEELTKSLNEAYEEREKRYNDKVVREEKIIELLQSIDKNTSILYDVVILLKENVENQKEILEIINEINTLPTIKDKDNMTSTYRKIMNRINTALSDVNTINVLCCYALTIFNSIK